MRGLASASHSAAATRLGVLPPPSFYFPMHLLCISVHQLNFKLHVLAQPISPVRINDIASAETRWRTASHRKTKSPISLLWIFGNKIRHHVPERKQRTTVTHTTVSWLISIHHVCYPDFPAPTSLLGIMPVSVVYCCMFGCRDCHDLGEGESKRSGVDSKRRPSEQVGDTSILS